MKYFTKELIEKNSNISDMYDDEWVDVCKKYNEYYNSIKHRFSNHFINIYNKNNSFHDFDLKSVMYYPFEKKVSIVLLHRPYLYTITYSGVNEYKFHASQAAIHYSHITWLYDEFEIVDEKSIRHSVLFVDRDFIDFEITFKRVKIHRKHI